MAWAPNDGNALSRILSQYPDNAPTAMLLIAPLPTFPGVSTTSQYFDLWLHPLLSDKHAAVVRGIHLLPQPVEYVLPGPRGPRHVHQGLACFYLAREGARALPTVRLPKTSILQASGSDSITIDTPTALLPQHMSKLASLSEFQGRTIREPTRSLGSTSELPRTSVELFLPPDLSALGRELLVRNIRRVVQAHGLILGQRDLYTAADALILECLSPSVVLRAAILCSEARFLTATKLPIRTEASAATWTELLDNLCKEGELNIITKIRWKASRFGGRPFALPSATSTAFAAARRRRGPAAQTVQSTDFVTEVRLQGDPGLQDREIFNGLVHHVLSSTGIQLRASSSAERASTGFWVHLPSVDASAPPGCARLYLGSKAEVEHIYEALDGQVVQVGLDWLKIEVRNDLLSSSVLSGNGGRAPSAIPGRP